jgi:protein archease
MKAGAGEYEFRDAVTSDLAVELRAPTLEGVFTALADALVAATLEHPEALRTARRRSVELDAPDLERLLLRFANELIFLRDAERLVLRAERVAVHTDGVARLSAELVGEPIDRDRHGVGADVKAATAHGLALGRVGEGWRARMTFDV